MSTFTYNNFEKVKYFMSAMGQEIPDKVLKPKDKPDITKLRVSLIEEELNELKDAVEKNDIVEVVDALADILYVTYGAGAAWGIDLQTAFNYVHDSNMSKICSNSSEALETIQWYKDNKADVYPEPTYRHDADGKCVVFEKTTGKILKSINYKPVDLKALT